MWRILVTLAVILVGLPGAAQAQDEGLYQDGKTAWGQHLWPGAYVPLRQYRLQSYGKRPDVDYMLGTSGCRITGLRLWGGNMLEAMLYAYPLTVESRRVVEGELQLCRAGTSPAGDELELALIDWPPAGMTAVFKTFYWSDDRQPVASYPMRRLETYPREHFTERLVPLGDRAAALEMAEALSPGAAAVISDQVVLISESGQSRAELDAIAAGLDRYVRFLQEEYGIGSLDHYVTIHLVPDPSRVQAKAQELHGLDVSGATLGYAYADDLSVVAFVPDVAPGTVLHELFHLLVRSGYGDIPQWLDEGIASLYEVSVTDGERYWGVDNWRGEVLTRLWEGYRPTVEQLVRSDWYLFDDPAQAAAVEAAADNPDELIIREEESARQAAMMAMARYFAFYLQDTGRLEAVFQAMRSSDPAAVEDRLVDPRAEAASVVEASLQVQSLDAIDRAFADWFLGGGAAAAGRPADAVVEKALPGRPHAALTAVNIRRGPGTAFDRIGELGPGDRVTVLAVENGWAEIVLRNGGGGYVAEQYLTPLQ